MVARWRSMSPAERLSVKDSGRQKTEVDFCSLLEKGREQEVRREPSYGVIPRFWVANRTGYTQALKRAAEARCERELSLLTWDQLERLRLVLRDAQSEPDDDSRRINYEAVCRARLDIGSAGSSMLSARLFLELPRDRHGRVSARELYNRVDRATCAAKTLRALRPYANGKAYLREQELERYIYDLIPDMPAAQSMDEKFHAFYVFTASRRFMFFLDRKRQGRISLRSLAASPLSLELHEVAELPATIASIDMSKASNSPPPAPPRGVTKASSLPTTFPPGQRIAAPVLPPPPPVSTSWFFPDNAKRVYSDYLELDVDQNGMLSKREFVNFRGHRGDTRLTDAFADRVFEEIITYRTENPPYSGHYESEMDFKTYLDIVLAFENVEKTHAISYFWRILDVNKHGKLDPFIINYFFRDVAARLEQEGFDPPSTADVVDEIFDMVS